MNIFTSIIAIAISISSNAHAAANDIDSVNFSPRSDQLTEEIDQALKSRGSGYKPRTEHLLADGKPKYTID